MILLKKNYEVRPFNQSGALVAAFVFGLFEADDAIE